MSGKYFKNKTAVITGAASGIGRSFALQLADLGTNLVISDINMERLEQVKDEVTKRGVKALAIRCDVTDAAQASTLAKNAVDEFGDIHFLFSNAGIASGGFSTYLSMAQWDKIIKINVWGMINIVTTFLPRMLEQGFGHVIVTSSIAGSIGIGGLMPYSTTKFANAGFCEALYGEYHPKGINVSIVCPFPLRTNLIETVGVSYPPELEEGYDREAVEQAIATGKAHYWDEFTKPSFITSGFGGGMDVDRAVKKFLKAIQKKRLYIFENRLGRLFQFFRGASPYVYKKIIGLIGKRNCNLLSDTYQQAVDETKAALGIQ